MLKGWSGVLVDKFTFTSQPKHPVKNGKNQISRESAHTM